MGGAKPAPASSSWAVLAGVGAGAASGGFALTLAGAMLVGRSWRHGRVSVRPCQHPDRDARAQPALSGDARAQPAPSASTGALSR